MTSVRDLRAEDIRGAMYVDAGTPGQIHTIKLIMFDGHVNIYSGDDLILALAKAKERFAGAPSLNKSH